jgi:4-diphosphocytidyl-2-C-methyl-D-erythritol kinase
MSLTAFAPAKVNLFLHVGPPAASGYHPICSLMVFADVGDRLTLQAADAPDFQIHGPFGRELSADARNLVARAARALLEEVRRPTAPFQLALDKRLPIASGLGGGSSDAGAAFRLIRRALDLPVPDARLEELAAELGADGAACLWGRPVVAEGRGERLLPAPDLPEVNAVLVNPNRPVSTAEVYRRLDAGGVFGDVTAPAMPESFESAVELAAWLAGHANDLEAPAVAVEPEVGVVLETLRQEPETLLARVSGSGGTCFALCASDIEAEGLTERIEALAPGWWVRRCRLRGPWPDEVRDAR